MKELITNDELKEISTKFLFEWNAEKQQLKVDFDGNQITLGLMLGKYLVHLDENKKTPNSSTGIALALTSAVSYWKKHKKLNNKKIKL